MINVVLTGGHNIVRAGVRALLEKEGSFSIVAEIVNASEILDRANDDNHIDVVIADINMPGKDGFELIEKVKVKMPGVRVIIFTNYDNEKYVSRAFKMGASGYLLKNVSEDELVFSIKHVFSGRRYVCSELALRLLDRLTHMPEMAITDGVHDFELTTKEREVLALMAEGFTNQEIADKIFTSKRTIEGYRQSLMVKTGSRNIASLIKAAMVKGLIS